MTITHVDFRSRSIVSESVDYKIDYKTGTLSTDLDTSDDCSDSVTLSERSISKPKRERSTPVNVAGFTWQPLKQRFSRANVYFSPETQEAYSYGWWRFVERIGPYLVFNNYRYSVTTSKHQSQIGGYSYWRGESDQDDWGYSLLSKLGLKVDLYIEAPKGLQNLESAISHYERQIADLEAAIATKGSRKAKNAERLKQIDQLKIKIATVTMLQALRDKDDRKAAQA